MSCFDYPVDSQTILLKKRALRKELLQKEGLVDKKIAILSGSTVGQIRPVLELFLLHHGIRPTFWEGGYHLYYEDIVFGNEELKAFAEENDCRYVDIYRYVEDHTGKMATTYELDKSIHMNEAGCRIWMQLLKAYAQWLSLQ